MWPAPFAGLVAALVASALLSTGVTGTAEVTDILDSPTIIHILVTNSGVHHTSPRCEKSAPGTVVCPDLQSALDDAVKYGGNGSHGTVTAAVTVTFSGTVITPGNGSRFGRLCTFSLLPPVAAQHLYRLLADVHCLGSNGPLPPPI